MRTRVFELRGAVDDIRLARDNAFVERDDRQVSCQRRIFWLDHDPDPAELPHPFSNSPEDIAELKQRALDELQTFVDKHERLKSEFFEVRGRLAAHLDRERPLFGDRTNHPIALLPVRLETRFEGARKLKVRVYPDDIHVDALDPALTDGELRAGRAFWQTGDEEAWQLLLDRFSPRRAAWVAHATRPGSDPDLRRPGRRRPPRTVTMPTRWRFLGLVGNEVVVDRLGGPIPVPLPLGILRSDQDAPDAPGDWLVDFKAAERVGMAATLRLPAGHAGLDQLLVVGVQESEPDVATPRLHNLLRAHAFTGGLAFLEPGTPTNNTPESVSDWSSRRPPRRPARRAPELHDGTDARRLTRWLGFGLGDFLALCPGAERDTEAPARAMTMLSWAALTEHFVRSAVSLRGDVGSDGFAELDPRPFVDLRRHVVSHVRSRGVAPTIRVGRQPYGLLPVSTLDEWTAHGEEPAEEMIVPWLLRLRTHWRAALTPGWIARVGEGRSADQTAVDALVRLPTARDLVVRRVLSAQETIATFDKRSPHSGGPVVSVGGVPYNSDLRWMAPSELTSNLAWVSDTQPSDFAQVPARLTPDPARDRRVLRRSAEKYADAIALFEERLSAREYLARWFEPAQGRHELPAVKQVTLFESFLPNRDLVLRLLSYDSWSRYPRAFDTPEDDLTAAMGLVGAMDLFALGQTREDVTPDLVITRESIRPRMVRSASVLNHLRILAEAPEGELLPLVFEVLDVLSHRWDAWVTSLPAKRLRDMREQDVRGVRLGGYGWVENLRRNETIQRVEGSRLLSSPGQGYVHAPSLQHAATAAVLRSGFLGHPGETTFAVDLSSRRVRAARWTLAGVRRGQDLGSLLGYRLERGLHDLQLDVLIGTLRRRFPTISVPPQAGEETSSTWQNSRAAIAARNVVDGLALVRALPTPELRAGLVAELVAVAPAAAGPRQDDLRRLVEEVADVLDAVGDLVLAESVHQLVGGNPLRSGLAADTLGRGEQVPDRFDVVRTPRRGRALTNRVVALVTEPGPSGGWGRDAIGDLDPRLDAWVAHLLGPADSWVLRGRVGDGDDAEEFERSAADLGFSALATALTGADERGRLERRLRDLVGRDRGAVVITGGWTELSAVLASVRSVLAGARALRAAQVGDEATEDLEELRGRVASFAEAVADREVRRELGVGGGPRRLAALVERVPPRPRDADRWLSRVTDAVAELLGTPLPIAPVLDGELPGRRRDVSASTVADWLRRYGAVRSPVRAVHDLVSLGAVRQGRVPSLSVAQHPAAGSWVGGRYDAAERPPAREHWVVHTPGRSGAGGRKAGFVLDEWSEMLPGSDALAVTKRGAKSVPVASELTGLAFRFDRPDAKAPQAVLLAVPPNLERGWTADTLALVVRDALELAKLRAVDLGDLPLLDDLLPVVRAAPVTSALGSMALDFWIELAES